MLDSLDAWHDFLRRHEVPEDWTVCQIRELAYVVGGGTPSREESRYWSNGEILWATPTDLTTNRTKYICETAERITREGLAASAAKLLPQDSILFTSRATIGAKAITKAPIATNQGFASLIPRKINGEYLFYLLDLLIPIIKRLGSGTTFDEVSKRDIKKVWCAIPSCPGEQQVIALILDAVDSVIERTREAMEHAFAVKTALAQQLFSEGIGGEKLKKTPIGLIPESWDVATVGSVALSFQYGLSVPMQHSGITPILRMGNIQNGEILLDDLKYVSLPEKVIAPYVARRGDVFFNRTNSQQHVGKVGIYRHDDPTVFASYLIRVVPNPELIDNYFLGQVLNSYSVQYRIKRYATPGVQQVNINATNLGKVLIPLPSSERGLKEQREIAAILEQADEMVRHYQPVLEAQQELKRSLMHDLLTGKMRVNNLIVEGTVNL